MDPATFLVPVFLIFLWEQLACSVIGGKKWIFWNLNFFPTTTLYHFMYFHFMKLDSIILPYHMSDAHVLCTPTFVSYSNFSDHNFPCPSCLVESQMYPNVAILRANSSDELKDSRTSSPANDILSFTSHSQWNGWWSLEGHKTFMERHSKTGFARLSWHENQQSQIKACLVLFELRSDPQSDLKRFKSASSQSWKPTAILQNMTYSCVLHSYCREIIL